MKIKNYVRNRLLPFPRLNAIVRSIYLLPKQYEAQLFYTNRNVKINQTQSRNSIVRKSKFEKMLKRQRFLAKFPVKNQLNKFNKHINQFFEISHTSKIEIDVCIPVFNRFDLVERLITQIQSQIKITEDSLNAKINLLIMDDCSSKKTSDMLRNLCEVNQIRYQYHESNLGVVGNVNWAFANTKGTYFVLFNSDAQLSNFGLLNILKPLVCDPKVALVTAPNFDQVIRWLPEGCNWKTLNEELERVPINVANYVDACTAVSYAIAIRRSAIYMPNLMDPIYGKGYGEDSDLHYKMVNMGWRSVWTLDTVVSHFGGASFGDSELANSHRSKGREIFFERWGTQYLREIHQAEEILELSWKLRLSGLTLDKSHHELYVLPANNPAIGGLAVGQFIFEESLNNGRNPAITVLDSHTPTNYFDITKTISSKNITYDSAQVFVLFGIGAIRWFRQQYFGEITPRIIFALQGPDWVIDYSSIDDFIWLRENCDEFLVTSNHTKKWASEVNENAKISHFTIPLKHAEFSGYENNKKEYDVTFLLRSEFGKGAHLALSLANFLSNVARVRVISGIPTDGIDKRIDLVEITSPSNFYKYLSESKTFIDTSLYEGFGMSPRQAAILGCKVFIFPFAGSTSELLAFPNHFKPLCDPADLFENAKLITNELEKPNCNGCDWCVPSSSL